MNLTQQLEDKKKKLKVIEDDIVNCKIIKKSVVSYLYKGSDDEKYYKQCIYDKKRLQAEIAILEQAIAEIKSKEERTNNLWVERINYFNNIKTWSFEEKWTELLAQVENIQSQQQNDRKINLGETTLVDGMQTIVTQENISADISNLLQKQRQEILDKIRLEFHTFREEFIKSELNIEDFDIGNLLYNIEQQLNQPKTEKENSKQ